MKVYALLNGIVAVAMSENITEIYEKKLEEHPRIRPFLTIAMKSCDDPCYRRLDSDEVKDLLAEEKNEPVRPERTARDVANEILESSFPITPHPDPEPEGIICSHCGDPINGIHVYWEVHDMGKQSEWDSKLPQPSTPYLCIPCLRRFKDGNGDLTVFMEVRK